MINVYCLPTKAEKAESVEVIWVHVMVSCVQAKLSPKCRTLRQKTQLKAAVLLLERLAKAKDKNT